MNQTKDAIDHARASTQELHKALAASTATDHVAIRTEISSAGDKAHELAASLKAVASSQNRDAKQHIADAVSDLEEVSRNAKAVSSANAGDIKNAAGIVKGKLQDAIHHLSSAVATKRAVPASAK